MLIVENAYVRKQTLGHDAAFVTLGSQFEFAAICTNGG
ncbi:hypothetical protein ROLI_030300 [Roseobacter fucihabitans]|uniref:Uncharacterized protein n=1 Tax=Roseobacter fucihabitans TaxID=1537242 RepID=A0ABZ2BWV3_9RHOB|nr:hypothetical protein [Roseobacter litoralis]MBC6968070.1 hypothetical protein [Roseobacter litoralis]